MRWEKFSKALEELGKWFLNAGLAFLVGLVIQPFTKGENKYVPIGLLGILIVVPIGVILILISEFLKEGSDKL
jgi:hypothetical protein